MVRSVSSAQRLRRQHARAVARMYAGLFDVLHDAGDQHFFAVAQGVHIDLRGILQEAVDQHRALLRERHGLAHVLADHLLVVGDHHGAAAQHVAGAHQHRVADPPGHFAGFLHAGGRTVGGAGNAQVVEQFAEQLAVLGQIDVRRVGADDGHAQALQRQRQIQRRLPAELHDDAVGLLGVVDVEDVLQGQRLEVQAVAGVVVGRDGLRVAVDHDRLDAHLLQRERRVAAAVVEFDSLADAVGAAAENHHLLAIHRVGFARRFVVGVQIRCEALELRGAGIHAAEDGAYAQLLAAVADRDLVHAPRAGKLHVGDAVALGAAEQLGCCLRRPGGLRHSQPRNPRPLSSARGTTGRWR